MTDIINNLPSLINQDPFLLFFGAFLLVLGLSCFFARDAWEEFAALFADNDSLSLIFGILLLPVALSIIAFYNNWDSLASTVLMVVGWIALVKSLSLLMRPQIIQGFIQKEFVRKWLWLDGLSGVALGAAMLFL